MPRADCGPRPFDGVAGERERDPRPIRDAEVGGLADAPRRTATTRGELGAHVRHGTALRGRTRGAVDTPTGADTTYTQLLEVTPDGTRVFEPSTRAERIPDLRR